MKLVERGMVVSFQAQCTADGKYAGLVTSAELVNEADPISDPASNRGGASSTSRYNKPV